MKKQLLSIFAALTLGTALAQTVSTQWSTIQNAAFTNTSTGIRYLDAVDNNVIWVMGYDGTTPSRNYNWFSRSINGGTTWNSGTVYQSTLTPAIGDTNTFVPGNIEGIDATTAWVCAYRRGPQFSGNTGGGGLHRTTNGGLTWTNMTGTGMFTNTAQSFANFVTFLTPSIGIVNGDPVNNVYEMWRTTDGGLSWTQIPSANIPAPQSTTEFAIVNLYTKYGTSRMWFGTNEGRIFYTTDAGITWNVSACAAATSTITEIAFNSNSTGVAYAIDGSGNFEMFNTTNGGVTWNPISPVSANVGRSDISGVPGTNYFVSTGSGNNNNIISYSTDNGVTWTDYGSIGIQYLNVDFATNTTGWAGSFSSITTASVDGVYKYSGAAITTTALPSSAFAVAANLCLSGPTATAALTNSSTGSPAPTYSWSVSPAGPVFSSPTASAPTITFASSNTYTITLLATSPTGTNSSTQVITVQACSAPVAAFTTPTASICNNNNISPNNTSTGGSPAPSYSWSAIPAAGVTFSPSSIAFSPGIRIANAGTYTINMVATNSQGSVSATQTVVINDCRPAISYTIPSTLPSVYDFCETTSTLSIINTTSLTNGSNTYTWTVQPTASTTVLGGTTPTPRIRLTSRSILVYTITARATNASGTSSLVQTFSVELSNCTGVEENSSLENTLSVFPNPAHDQINIAVTANTSDYNVILTNILGEKVLEQKVNADKGNTTINVANRSKGVYFITIEANRQRVTRKIVIE